MDCEDGLLAICGPRVGKTTSLAVPMICEAPGSVLATSNKRDIVDLPRAIRAKRGRVWVFDPQGISGEPPTWYWDMIGYINSAERAMEIATVFMDCKPGGGDATNAGFFREMGRNLLAGLFLAASRSGAGIDAVRDWLADQSDQTPLRILRESGDMGLERYLRGIYQTNPQQRDGYFGEASSFANVFLFDEITDWIRPSPGREAFDIEAFVRSGCQLIPGQVRRPQTLFMLSAENSAKECPQYITALTVAVTRTAETIAATLPHGRLDVPLYAVLDEAANVCRWGALPKMYSHYGSRGIVLATILQSYAQGRNVWGKESMDAMWSAATTKCYGGGSSEVEFLRSLSQLVGEFWTQHVSVSTSAHSPGVSSSRQVSKEDIFSAADLAAIPRGYMVMLASGEEPLLVNTVPYWSRPYGGEVGQKPARRLNPIPVVEAEVDGGAGPVSFTPREGIRIGQP
nr:TraM recognition domain-containing protein [Nanchangia anserum]